MPPGAPVITGPQIIIFGQQVTLTCTVTDGQPTPTVKWLRDNVVIDETYTISGNTVVNTYSFQASSQEHLEVFECQSENGVLQNPKATTWHIYDAAGSVNTNDDTITDYSGNKLPFNPKVLFNLGAEFEKDKHSAFFKWQYMGKRQGNVANGFELAAYSIFNLGTGYKINDHLSANIVITNVFNSEGLANFFGANAFGANANGATPEFVAANPDASFVVFPVLGRRALFQLNYSF